MGGMPEAMTPYPLRFRPLLKRTIWGGRRLGDQLGKAIGPEADYAESWEIVDHGADQSLAENGSLSGCSLSDILGKHHDWLVGPAAARTSFPLLLKYLDCNRVLSVQVHPDDAYGQSMSPPDLGKTEAWYIVASNPDSLIYAGLKPGVDRKSLEQAVHAGETASVLHAFHPEPGDVVFIPAGTVHALGAGLLVAEIQQSSDTTFRLFDWNRVGVDGKPRPLHIRESLEVSDYQSGPVHPRRADPDHDRWQELVRCDKFVLRVLQGGRDQVAGDGKFHILTVPRATATLRLDGETFSLRTGQTLLLPASLPQAEISADPEGVVLGMHLPD
jgi:mannose-6-phosphate isomerase